MFGFIKSTRPSIRGGALVLFFLCCPARADIRITLHNQTEAPLAIVRSGEIPFVGPPFLQGGFSQGPWPQPGCRAFLGLVGPGSRQTIALPDRETCLEAELTVRNLSGAGGFVFGGVTILPLATVPCPPDGIYPEPEASEEGPFICPLKGLPRPPFVGPDPEPEDLQFGQ